MSFCSPLCVSMTGLLVAVGVASHHPWLRPQAHWRDFSLLSGNLTGDVPSPFPPLFLYLSSVSFGSKVDKGEGKGRLPLCPLLFFFSCFPYLSASRSRPGCNLIRSASHSILPIVGGALILASLSPHLQFQPSFFMVGRDVHAVVDTVIGFCLYRRWLIELGFERGKAEHIQE